MAPRVTVIIPTYSRPHFLPRAVESALAGMAAGEVEVIVVPNGPDESWKESLKPFHGNKNVRILPIPEANANIARNAGLAVARGEFVRFLDDDDYLVAEGAKEQYKILEHNNVDIVCGRINAVNPDGKVIRTFIPPSFDDFCQSITSSSAIYLLHAYVYRRNIVEDIRWNPHITSRQDYYWLFDICKSKEISWIKCNIVVGVWQHHWGRRISIQQNINNSNSETAETLIDLYYTLKKTNRLNTYRTITIAEGIWFCIHSSFHLSPEYWKKISITAKMIDPQSKPSQAIYNWPVLKYIDPIIMQWLLLPKRRFNYIKRNIFRRLKSERFW